MITVRLTDLIQRYQKLNQKNDLLIRLNKIVPWEEFRPILEQILQKPRKSNASRKPIDVVLMFKLLLLQKLYSLSDEQLEYQVNDHLSFIQFLGLISITIQFNFGMIFSLEVPNPLSIWVSVI